MTQMIDEYVPYHEFLKGFAAGFTPKIVVEIGTNAGLSANSLKAGYPEMQLYTMDIIHDAGYLIEDDSVIKLVGESRFLSKKVPQEIDLLFIDGDHTYNGCKLDYELYSPLVKKGGVILIDDILESEGVNKFWTELKLGSVLKGVHGKHGMGIIRK